MSSFNPLGMLRPSSQWGVYNNIRFMVQQALAQVQTASVVKVMACTNDGGVSPVGTVDAQILVNQVNGQGNPTPHATMYCLPYLRIQGGANAVIIDPQPGDIGIAVFASRDITNVKSTKTQANPGSFRMYDFSDGMYIGGLLNDTPSQYLQFSSAGIALVSSTEVKSTAPAILLSNGGSAEAMVLKPFYDFWNTNILPFLQGLGYTGPIPPTGSISTVVKGE